MTVINSTLLVLLGWALGLLGAPIVERIQRRYRAREIKDGLRVELVELRYTMASCVHLFRQRLATLDHATLEWLARIESLYSGPDKEPDMAPGLQGDVGPSPGRIGNAPSSRQETGSWDELETVPGILPSGTGSQLGTNFLPSLQQHLLQIKGQSRPLERRSRVSHMRQFDLTFDPSIGQGCQIVVMWFGKTWRADMRSSRPKQRSLPIGSLRLCQAAWNRWSRLTRA